DRLLVPEPAGDLELWRTERLGLRPRLGSPLLVKARQPRLDTRELAQEVEMERSPPELAVGDAVKPNLLLHLDRTPNGIILERRETGHRPLAGKCRLARLPELGRPQQRADVIGAKRRPYAGQLRCHWLPSSALDASAGSVARPGAAVKRCRCL